MESLFISFQMMYKSQLKMVMTGFVVQGHTFVYVCVCVCVVCVCVCVCIYIYIYIYKIKHNIYYKNNVKTR